jgi:predicted flap endonuclease-1-like 5' DNA nuclease
MTKLLNIEGIGPVFAEKLKKIGIKSIESLLAKGGKPGGRKMISQKSGIDETYILEWVNHADLFRIKGVGEEYSDLLEEAGVDTVVELAQRNPDNLHQKIIEVNKMKKLVRRPPSLSAVENWVNQAKSLPRAVHH